MYVRNNSFFRNKITNKWMWHINQYSLINAKSIFIHINSSISNNSVKHKYSLVLFNPLVLPLPARVNLGAMAMKEYSAFSKASVVLASLHQIVKCHIQDTRWGCLNPLQRSSLCSLQPQPTGQ